jgi:hypothetical protein
MGLEDMHFKGAGLVFVRLGIATGHNKMRNTPLLRLAKDLVNAFNMSIKGFDMPLENVKGKYLPKESIEIIFEGGR